MVCPIPPGKVTDTCALEGDGGERPRLWVVSTWVVSLVCRGCGVAVVGCGRWELSAESSFGVEWRAGCSDASPRVDAVTAKRIGDSL